MAEFELVLDAQATIGESPLWSPGESALYWSDVKAPALYRFHPSTGYQQNWLMESDIGGFALCPELDAALVALRTGIYRLAFATGVLTQLSSAPFDPATHRFNDAACDPSGRFWVGAMFDPLDPAAEPQKSSLFSFTVHDGLRAEPDEAELHNGIAWTPDSKSMFLTHTTNRKIYRFSVNLEGQISNRMLFATIPEGDGLPDGAALDAEGGYWCALHGGGRLRRFNPDGSHDRDILLPVSQPTMCAFGGENLDILYVTSATDGLTAEQRRLEPQAGALLALRPGETGSPRRWSIR